MNTNTIEQAVRLKELGVSSNISLAETIGVKGGNFPTLIAPGLRSKYHEEKGPALFLDDLHRVFESIEFWPELYISGCVKDGMAPTWGLNYTFTKLDFLRTKNHAEDWAAILIWLLENNHVKAQQANEALAQGKK